MDGAFINDHSLSYMTFLHELHSLRLFVIRGFITQNVPRDHTTTDQGRRHGGGIKGFIPPPNF